MEAFSDGVFAIAITLLVLEIGVREGSENLWGALVDERPSYLAYLASFGTIGVVWLEHTVVTEHLDHATPALMRLDLLLPAGRLRPPLHHRPAGRVRGGGVVGPGRGDRLRGHFLVPWHALRATAAAGPG